jgi:hypothetical protein
MQTHEVRQQAQKPKMRSEVLKQPSLSVHPADHPKGQHYCHPSVSRPVHAMIVFAMQMTAPRSATVIRREYSPSTALIHLRSAFQISSHRLPIAHVHSTWHCYRRHSCSLSSQAVHTGRGTDPLLVSSTSLPPGPFGPIFRWQRNSCPCSTLPAGFRGSTAHPVRCTSQESNRTPDLSAF